MSLDEVDRALAAWKDRLRRVDENLLALEGDINFKLLEETSAPGAGLAGVTYERVAPVVAAMRELFAQRSHLDEILERAQRTRGTISRLWPADRTLREISALLRGPSIVLSTVQTPLAQRTLLGEAEDRNAVSPDQLLAAMVKAFETVRDTVTAVARVWDQLTPQLDALQQKLASLNALATALGGPPDPDLAALQTELALMRTRVARDPLGVHDDVARRLEPRLTALNDRLAAQGQERAQTRADLARARQSLAALRDASRAVAESFASGRAEIAEPTGLVASPAESRLADLATWLATLETTASAGQWRAAQVGLTRFRATLDSLLAGEQAALAANRARLAVRDDVSGLLLARQVQLHSLRARGVTDGADLERRAEEILQLLRYRPLPLATIEDQFAAFEARIGRLVGH
jgi:hypothetical protein